jgi:basic membrane protein A
VPNVSYNGSTYEACPETFIVSSAINWTPYYVYITKCIVEDKAIDTNWCGGIEEGSVVLTGINQDVAAEGTVDAIAKAVAELKAGTLKVFNTANFTVDGKVLEDDLVVDGYYNESGIVSAPSFSFNVDGITRLNENFG